MHRAAQEIDRVPSPYDGFAGCVMGRKETDGGYKYAGERTEFVNVGVASQNAT